MEALATYLEHAFEQNFVQGRYTNTVRDLYGILRAAILLGADSMTITPSRITLAKLGVSLRQIDIDKYEKPTSGQDSHPMFWKSFLEGMHIILKYDMPVRRHVKLIEESPDAVAYRLLPDTLASEAMD